MWDPLHKSEYSGPGVGYNVYFKKKDDPKEWFRVKVQGAETNMYSHLVGADNYYLECSVKVGAFNIHGSGPNSSVHSIMSAEGMPVATVKMGDCDNYNGSAFSMTWEEIEGSREALKGRLRGYRIRYWHADYPEFIVWRDIYGQASEAIIIGLEDNTNYWASVQVMNHAGVGPIGEIRLAETYHLPPMNYPRFVTVYPNDEHSVLVTWQGIATSTWAEETLQGYIDTDEKIDADSILDSIFQASFKLRVWKIQEDIRTAVDYQVDKVDDFVEEEAIIDNLQTQTVYVLRVLGFSIGGEGSLSPHVYFTVGAGSVPFDPTTTRFCFGHEQCSTTAPLKISVLLMCLIQVLVYML